MVVSPEIRQNSNLINYCTGHTFWPFFGVKWLVFIVIVTFGDNNRNQATQEINFKMTVCYDWLELTLLHTGDANKGMIISLYAGLI